MARVVLGKPIFALCSLFFLVSCSNANFANSGSQDLSSTLEADVGKVQKDLMSRAKICKPIITNGIRFYDNAIIVSKSGLVNAASFGAGSVKELHQSNYPEPSTNYMTCSLEAFMGLMTREDIDSKPIPLNKPVPVSGTCTKKQIFNIESQVFYPDYSIVQFIEKPGKIQILSKTRQYPDCNFSSVYINERDLEEWSDELVGQMDRVKRLPVCEIDTSTGQDRRICVNI